MDAMQHRQGSPPGEHRLYQTVARKIASIIRANEHDPNWRMPSERELAELLQVSRPVVREAVIALEMRGVVEVRGRSGIVVLPSLGCQVSFEPLNADIGPGPFELLEARLAIEPGIAALAADRVTQYDIALLEECIARMLHEPDHDFWNEGGDQSFHFALAKMTGNVIIVGMVEALWSQRQQSAMWHKLVEHIDVTSVRSLWIGDHHAILAALRQRNPDAAQKAMGRHIRNVIVEFSEAEDRGHLTA
ncbi:FadR/GntR family transcriptional regulator [Pelagibacterium limicola]|uniref:FadR/GntR family transcriptional regulator n=1 Tax=Pelagibacterium limicola TaxID=2791022 RepID=UPI001FE382BA|nr:FadR/GntR family transcriptional regulator [Pelagibacterium limicola]